MEILAILWPIGYVTCEELQVGHNLTMAKGEKQRLYRSLEFNHTNEVRNNDPKAQYMYVRTVSS